jgi:hypothetical protein
VSSRLETARRPAGLNDVFLQYGNTRWFRAGRTVEFSPGRFEQIGEYHGFPVYAERGRRDVIYIPAIAGEAGLLTPYTQRL